MHLSGNWLLFYAQYDAKNKRNLNDYMYAIMPKSHQTRIQRGGGGELTHFCDFSGGSEPPVGQGVRTPLINHKNIGFLSNTGPDPLKITKLPSQHSM